MSSMSGNYPMSNYSQPNYPVNVLGGQPPMSQMNMMGARTSGGMPQPSQNPNLARGYPPMNPQTSGMPPGMPMPPNVRNPANMSAPPMSKMVMNPNTMGAPNVNVGPPPGMAAMNMQRGPVGNTPPTGANAMRMTSNPSMPGPGAFNGPPDMMMGNFQGMMNAVPPSPTKNPLASSGTISKADNEFSLATEDFPALPGFKGEPFQPSMNTANISYAKQQQSVNMNQMQPTYNFPQESVNMPTMQRPPSNQAVSTYEQFLRQQQQQQQPAQPQMQPKQQKTFVPDRYGLLGLLSVIRMTDPDLNTLALGTDLTTLGLNLNSPDNLYSSFVSPWAEGPSRREPDYYIPMCYYLQTPLTSPAVKSGSLPFNEETLFYIFYSMPRDSMQITAAHELYKRDWRYHKEYKLWLTRVSGTEPSQKTATYERGSYYFFDIGIWEKVRKDNFVLVYDQIEAAPTPVANPNANN